MSVPSNSTIASEGGSALVWPGVNRNSLGTEALTINRYFQEVGEIRSAAVADERYLIKVDGKSDHIGRFIQPRRYCAVLQPLPSPVGFDTTEKKGAVDKKMKI